MAIQLTFQLDNQQERAEVIKCINAMEGNMNPRANGLSEFSSKTPFAESQNSLKINDLTQENKVLKNDIKKHQENNKKNEDKISKLQEELAALRTENEKKIEEAEYYKKLYEETDEEIKKVKEECELKLKQKIDECGNEIKRIVNKRNEQEKKLNDRITELQSQLEIYNPSINMKTSSETSYYRVDGNMLMETNSMDAPYMAQRMENDKYQFQFNFEKGPVQEACMNRTELLLPFCDIVEEAENPSIIRPSEWGIAILVGGDLKVETKAKINLYRD